MQTHVVEPSAISISETDSTRRNMVRPPDQRDPTYKEKYDDRTLFYDAIPVGTRLILPGPPLLNLESIVSDGKLTLSGTAPTAVQTTHMERAQLTVLSFDREIKSAEVLTLEHDSISPIEARLGDSFADFLTDSKVLVTMQKDEELEWIHDWATYYSRIHECDALLIFDNSSVKYSNETLVDKLRTVPGIKKTIVVKWPFKYGPQGGNWEGKDAPWDSDFCQIGAFQTARYRFLTKAAGMINADIDELVVPLTDTKLFDALAASEDGVLGYGGHWIENVPTHQAKGDLPRFWNHVLTKDRAAPCASKWSGVPSLWDDRVQPTAHYVRQLEYLPSPDFYIAHFRALNSGWKSTDRLVSRQDHKELDIDGPLTVALNRAFARDSEIPDYGFSLPNATADMHQYHFQTWLRSKIDESTNLFATWNKKWLWKYAVPVFESKALFGQVAFDLHIDDSHIRMAVAVRNPDAQQALQNALKPIEPVLDELTSKHMGFWTSAAPYCSVQDSTWVDAAEHITQQMRLILQALGSTKDDSTRKPSRAGNTSSLSQGPLRNLRDDDQFSSMADSINAFADGRTLLYVPNQGNWGDALIHKGTIQFLEHFKIPYTLTSRPEVLDISRKFNKFGGRIDDLVLTSGGGGFWRNPNSGNYSFVKSASSSFTKTIVMPHTFEAGPVNIDHGEFLYHSRDSSLSKISIPESSTCHDMAFFLQLPALISAPTSKSGTFLRADPERHPAAHAVGTGYDLSSMGNHLSAITPFFQILQQFSHIVTDRMHVAIGGAMLGATVDLYPGNYGKAESVFLHSLRDNYPNVTLRNWQ